MIRINPLHKFKTLITITVLGCILLPSQGCQHIEPPVANAGEDMQVSAGIPVSLSAEGSHDPQGRRLKYSWNFIQKPQGSKAILVPSEGLKTYFVPDTVGTYKVTLVVDNGILKSLPDTVIIEAGPCGKSAPRINAIKYEPDQPDTSQPIKLSAQIEDADNSEQCGLNQTFSYKWEITALPSGSKAKFNDNTQASPWFMPDIPGEYEISLTVTDSTGISSSRTATTIQVSGCGANPPEIVSVSIDPESPSTLEAVKLTPEVTDADNEEPCNLNQGFYYEWHFTSIPEGSQSEFNYPHIFSPHFVPDTEGRYIISLVVTDSTGKSSSPFYTEVNVSSCGSHPPIIENISYNPAHPGVGENIKLISEVSDADSEVPCNLDQSLSYSWRFLSLPVGSEATFDDPTSPSPRFHVDEDGVYLIELVVEDSTGRKSRPETVSIEISECGTHPPYILQIIYIPDTPFIGDVIALSPIVTDADSNPPCNLAQQFTYHWQMVSLPEGSSASLNDSGSPEPWFIPDEDSIYTLELIVEDNEGHYSEPEQISIAVSNCGGFAPVISSISTIPPSPNANQPIKLIPQFTDSDNDDPCNLDQNFQFDWEIIAMPAGASAQFDDPSARSPNLTPDVGGSYTVRLVITDETGRRSTPFDYSINVSPCGSHSPVINSLNAIPSEPIVSQPVTLSADVTDLDNEPACGLPQALSYYWDIVALPAGSGSTLNASEMHNPFFIPDTPGDYTISLTVTDSTGNFSSAFIDIRAAMCGSFSPQIRNVTFSPASPTVGQTVGMTIEVYDSDNDPVVPCFLSQTFSYSWNFISIPAGSTAELHGKTTSTPWFIPDAGGRYAIRAIVTDSTGLKSSPFDTTINVSNCGGNPPVISEIIFNPPSPITGATVQLTATVDDADNSVCGLSQTLSYRWDIVGSPPGATATLNAPYAESPSFTADQPGLYTIRLVVSDETGRTSNILDSSVNVSVCGSNAPQILDVSVNPGAPIVGDVVQVTAQVEDMDNSICGLGQSFSYSWSWVRLPAGTTVEFNSRDVSNPTFRPDTGGDYEVRVEVVDSTGLNSQPYHKTITVSPCGEAKPVINSITPSNPNPDTFDTVEFSASVSDSDNSVCGLGQSFNYYWRITSLPEGSTATLNSPTAETPSIFIDVPGSYEVELIVIDSEGFVSNPSRTTITASLCRSRPPIALVAKIYPPPREPISGGVQNLTTSPINYCTIVQLDGTPSIDLDNQPPCSSGQTLTYHWEMLSTPADSYAQLSNPDSATPFFTPDMPGTYIIRMWVSDGIFTNPEPAIITIPTAGNFLQVIDPLGGMYTSNRYTGGVAAGRVAVAYFEEDGQRLKYGECEAGGSCELRDSWSLTIIDETGDDVGRYASIDYDAGNASVGISYYDVDTLGNGRLKYAECDGECLDASNWIIGEVDRGTNSDAEDTGQFTSLVMTNSERAISYYDVTNGYLRYAWCGGNEAGDCNTIGDWQQWTVDSSANVGMYSSMDIDRGAGIGGSRQIWCIVYYDATNRALKYAECRDDERGSGTCSDGTDTWTTITIDDSTSSDVGMYASIEVKTVGGVGGIRFVSYYDAVNGNLMYARCLRPIVNPTACQDPANWEKGIVASTNNVGKYSSIDAFWDELSYTPQISYYDETTGFLMLAVCTGSCNDPPDATWVTLILDNCPDTGLYTSLELTPAGVPLVSYYSVVHSGLKYFDGR